MTKPKLFLQKLRAKRKISDYQEIIPGSAYRKIKFLASKLAGKKIVYVNSTPAGGGVVELLKNIIPLAQSLEVNASWCAFGDDLRFFEVSKKLHNSLQGASEWLTAGEKRIYQRQNEQLAKELLKLRPDVVMLQDPQPLGMVPFLPKTIKVISRIHIDLTNPHPDSLRFILPYLKKCHKVIFTAKSFVPKDLDAKKVLISPPGIDPLAPKNAILTKKQIQAVAESAGINRQQPLLVQVSRFDKWKDPIGAVQIYKLVKQDYPKTQLVLMGLIEAQDDPEALAVFEQVKKYVGRDPDVFLFSKKSQLRWIAVDTYVNAMQRMADVVLQKSLREGFGLTVTEAMWKGRAVIGGPVGGIKIQIKDGKNGFLADNVSDAAKIAIRLISNKALGRKLGENAHKTVLDKFLITRYLTDELAAMGR